MTAQFSSILDAAVCLYSGEIHLWNTKVSSKEHPESVSETFSDPVRGSGKATIPMIYPEKGKDE